MSIDFISVWTLCYSEALNFQSWNTFLTQEEAGSIPMGPVPCAPWPFYAQDLQLTGSTCLLGNLQF